LYATNVTIPALQILSRLHESIPNKAVLALIVRYSRS